MQIRHDTHRYEFLVETYRTERLKTLTRRMLTYPEKSRVRRLSRVRAVRL